MDSATLEMFEALARRSYELGVEKRDQDMVGAYHDELHAALSVQMPRELYRSVELVNANDAVRADPSFAWLTEGDSGPFIAEYSGGSRFDLRIDLVGLLESAWLQIRIDRVEASRENYINQAMQNLSDFESMRVSQTMPVRKVTALYGLELESGQSVDLPWGTVHSRTDLIGERRGAGEAFLLEALLVPLVISYGSMGELPDAPAGNELDVVVPLAFCLAGEGRGSVPMLGMRTTISPHSGRSGFGGPVRLPGRGSSTLSDEAWDKVVETSHLIAANHSPLLDVPARRLVQALQVRWDPHDILIDSVTAWEGLVGAEGETAYRVCAALAKLLADTPDARERLFVELKKVYSTRSKIVHGAGVKGERVFQAAEDAVRTAALAMLEIYRRGPSWTDMHSEDRSHRLMLDL